MGYVAKTRSNQLLKSERELRGWSQKHVADQIGADHYYLSRWERGTTSPSPYYRQKLCVLFGKNASELGLLPEDTGESDKESQKKAQDQPPVATTEPTSRVYDPTIPSPSSGGTELIGRTDIMDRLKQRLCSGQHLVISALNGIPGVGKTAVAIALAHDPAILDHFRDGILWVALGTKPNVLAALTRWGTLLGISPQEATTLITIEAWAVAIRTTIGTSRMLLVIDDAWQIEDALAFKIGGSQCAYIVTTRFPQIALQFADRATMLQELNEHDSILLLAQLSPEISGSEQQSLLEIVHAVGGLPLALTLIGRYLRAEAYSGQPRRIRAAIERLRTTEVRLHLSEPQALLERSPTLPIHTPVSLLTVIAVSDQQLDEPEKKAFRSLAVFPAKPNSFSEEAALAVCAVPAETLDALSDAGLLESRGSGRYTLHQTIADYARTQIVDVTPYKHLATYFAEYMEIHENDYDLLGVETENVFSALEAAQKYKMHAEYIKITNAFFHFLQTRGMYAQAEACLKQAEHMARSVQNIPDLVTILLNLGRLERQRGRYTQAEGYLQEGLVLARQNGDNVYTAHLLGTLGALSRQWGYYAQAEAYAQEALAMARQSGNGELISSQLKVLTVTARAQGNYIQAEVYAQEGLALARQHANSQQMCAWLTSLGAVAFDRGDYTQCEAYTLESLAMARQIGDRGRIIQRLTNLGALTIERGEYDLAKRYIEEALEMARQINHHERISYALSCLGAIATEQKNYIQADAFLQEALTQAYEIQQRELISEILTNQGAVALLCNNDKQAEQYLQESLAVARQIGHPWLTSIALIEWGNVYFKRQQFDAAYASLQEVLNKASENPRATHAIALYLLAQIECARGNRTEARHAAQESLALLELSGHSKVLEVRQWIAAN